MKKYLNLLKIVGGLAGAYFIYKTGKTWLIRRKYRHIPGPPTKGYIKYF